MSQIISNIDPMVEIFETIMPKFELTKLEDFCHLFEMDIDKDVTDEETGQKLLLGRIILCLLPKTIRKIKEEKPHFPMTDVFRISPSHRGIQENPIFIDDELFFRIQIKVPCEKNGSFKKTCCVIEICKDACIVFSGVFHLYEKLEKN